MNSKTIVHPRLHHLGMTTGNADAMVSWYRVVIGMDGVHRTDSASVGTKGATAMKSVWVTNGEANHRLAFVEVPGFSADENKAVHRRIQHFAFAYRTREELLGTTSVSRPRASFRSCARVPAPRPRSPTRTWTATASSFTSTTSATDGRQRSTCAIPTTPRPSPSATSSIRTSSSKPGKPGRLPPSSANAQGATSSYPTSHTTPSVLL